MKEVLLKACGSALVVCFLLMILRSWTERIHAAWAAVATRLGGTFVRQKRERWWRIKSARVEAKIGAVMVEMDHFNVGSGMGSKTYSRTRVATSCSKQLTSFRESIFSGVGKAFGMQDLLVGDPAYDERFVVQSDDEAWARSVLHELLRKEHLAAPKLRLQVKDGWVETLQVDFDFDVDNLERRMRLTAALAVAVEAHA